MWQLIREIVFEWIPDNKAALLIDLVLTALLAAPLIDFLTYGWARKAVEIERSLTRSAKRTYLEVFQDQAVPAARADDVFATIYRSWYGRRRLIFPIGFVLLIAIFENFFLAVDLLRLTSTDAKLQLAPAAIAGAYTFVAFDFFGRNQRRNLSIADIMRGALRLGIAVPLGYVFAALVQPDLAAFMAFAIGVFPLREIYGLLRQLANKRLGFEIGAGQGGEQVVHLSGLDTAAAERIEDADITTIEQLAWCDPIQLTMRTNLGFNFVIDIVSQALARVYFDSKLDAMRPYGLRGAVEIKSLMDDLASNDQQARDQAEAALTAAATAAQLDPAGFRFALDQIAVDPYTDFLYTAFTD